MRRKRTDVGIGWIVKVAILAALTQCAQASPFLVCTPVPTTGVQPTSYTVQGLPAVNVTVPATVNADGSVQLHYDLGGLAVGSYSVTATASNQWGTSPVSSPPFSFSSALPAAPTSLSVSSK